MSNPRIDLSVIDPGALARPQNTDQIPIFVGVCESGTNYEVRQFAREEALITYGGAGHLIDVAQSALQVAESVRVMKVPRDDAGVFEALDSDDTLTATALTGVPLQFLRGKIIITKSAIISGGTAEAKLSLDAWDIPFVDPSYSDVFVIPANGVVTLPGTGGLTVTLTVGQTPVVGAEFNFHTIAAHYDAAAIAACETPLLAPQAGIFTFLVFTGAPETAATANTNANAIKSLFLSFYSKGRFYPMLGSASLDVDTVVAAAFASTAVDPPFVSVGYGTAYWTSPRATPTRGRFALQEHDAAAVRIQGIAVSTDPGRGADKSIQQIVGVSYDAALEGSLLHDARIGTLRSWNPEATGYFVNRQRMLCAADSNFISWQFAAVMAEGLRATQRALFLFALETLRRTKTSTLDPRDAADVKTACEDEIDTVLVKKENARGLPGHISAKTVTPSLTAVLPELSVKVVLRPHGYPSDLTATLEYGNAD